MGGHVQRDDVGVGLLHGDAERLLAVLVLVVLRGAPFEEQAHLPGHTHTHTPIVSTLNVS